MGIELCDMRTAKDDAFTGAGAHLLQCGRVLFGIASFERELE